VPVEVNAQLDKLYRALYGRPADRFERVALVEYLDKRQEKLAKAPSVDEEGGDVPSPPTDTGKRPEQKLNPARAAAFVDLVHAVANSNEFSYRF
jgi:hypothetical protein